MIKTSFLRDPITLVRGRDLAQPFSFYETYNKLTGVGVPKDLTGYEFYCDFRLKLEDADPLFTLTNIGSPATIILEGTNKIILYIPKEYTALVNVPASNNRGAYPFTKVHFELKTISPEGEKSAAIIGSANVYHNITRSDDNV